MSQDGSSALLLAAAYDLEDIVIDIMTRNPTEETINHLNLVCLWLFCEIEWVACCFCVRGRRSLQARLGVGHFCLLPNPLNEMSDKKKSTLNISLFTKAPEIQTFPFQYKNHNLFSYTPPPQMRVKQTLYIIQHGMAPIHVASLNGADQALRELLKSRDLDIHKATPGGFTVCAHSWLARTTNLFVFLFAGITLRSMGKRG